MFSLTTHSTHFIYGYMASDMVKDHSDSEKGNPLPPHRLLFPINSKGSFICTTDRIAHTTAFITPVVEQWLKREIAQWVYPTKDRSDDPSHHERTLLPRSYILLAQIRIRRVVGSILPGGLIELFLLSASAPQLVYQWPWYVLSCLCEWCI